MSTGVPEQRNLYKGVPQRPWVNVRLIALDGSHYDAELIADTGSPFAITISVALMNRMRHRLASPHTTNFGRLAGGWVHVSIISLGWEQDALGYGNDAVARSARSTHRDFEGLVGLPFLRLFEYGGDADHFWLRKR